MGRRRSIITRIPVTSLSVRTRTVHGHWIKVADAETEEEAEEKLKEWRRKGHEAAIFENTKKRG